MLVIRNYEFVVISFSLFEDGHLGRLEIASASVSGGHRHGMVQTLSYTKFKGKEKSLTNSEISSKIAFAQRCGARISGIDIPRNCGLNMRKRSIANHYAPFDYCIISTITFLSSLEAAAFTTERIALAIRPCLPMTLPISDCATRSSTIVPFSLSVSVTTTSSGKSTSD